MYMFLVYSFDDHGYRYMFGTSMHFLLQQFFCCHGWIVPSVVRSPKSPEIRQADLTVSLELQSQPVFNGCFVKQPISYVKIWNHPIESTTYKWMFQVPGGPMAKPNKNTIFNYYF